MIARDIQTIAWLYEDELPPMTDDEYRDAFPTSIVVDGVRMFPVLRTSLIALASFLIAMCVAVMACADEPYDFYNPPPAYQVFEKPNAKGNLHFVAWGVVHDHMLTGQFFDIWAKSQDEAQRIADKLIAFPGTEIAANQQRLPIIGLRVERVSEWRVGKPSENEPELPSRNRGDVTPEIAKQMQKPGWVIDYRDREDVRDKEEAKAFIWIDRSNCGGRR